MVSRWTHILFMIKNFLVTEIFYKIYRPGKIISLMSVYPPKYILKPFHHETLHLIYKLN